MSERVANGALKTNGESPDQSPLVQIREKELEIRGRVMEAQKKAEKVVADARLEGAKLLDEASRKVEHEAATLHEAGVAEIERDVQAVAKSQDGETKTMVRGSRKRVAAAVDRVLRMIVP
jgi:vacuolar-type H+-ATPase subunit H